MAVGRVAGASKRTLVLFGLAFVLTTAELCWWVAFNVRETRKRSALTTQALERDRALVQKWLDTSSDGKGGRIDVPWLEAHFPQLHIDAQSGTVAMRPEAAHHEEGAQKAHVRMFVAEGAFFFFMVMLGAGLIMRTIRREVGVVRQQANFLNAVTHELKSPLSVMRLYIETLERRQLDPKTLARYVATLRAECDRLEVLVSHVLTLARLERRQRAEKSPSEGAPVLNIDDVLAQIIGQLSEGRRRGQPPIKHARAPKPVGVRMDEASLRTVLRNVLDNACKYGGDKAPIEVRVSRKSGRAICSVQDFGIGIGAGDMESIFERFFRVGDEMVRRHEGSGLGLYLVRMLLTDYGGTIAATSEGLGHGATFVVDLPAADVLPRQEFA